MPIQAGNPASVDPASVGPASVNPAARRFFLCFVLRLMSLSRRPVVHPDHHHKLVLTADGIGLRFYSLKLGTDCLQRQGIVMAAWRLLILPGFSQFHHALCHFDTRAYAAVALIVKI